MTTWIGYGPPWRIDGPPPLAPLYGLEQAAEAPAGGVRIVIDLDSAGRERWINGAQVYPYPPDQGGIHDTCAPASQRTKGAGGPLASPKFAAITVHLDETCTSYKVWDQERFKARAIASLVAVESAILARHFMSGEGLIDNPHLADGEGGFPNGDVVTGALDALSLIEEQIALSEKQGLIHCTPMFVDTLRERFAVDNKTGVIRTANGTVVIPDAGYAVALHNGSHPLGHAAPIGRQEWIYGTGLVDIRRSDIFTMPDDVSQALERGVPGAASTGLSNSITYRAERYYLVDWDTEVHCAVLADRCDALACNLGSSST